MARILLLFAHPALEKSRVHITILKHVQQITDITINDLYQEYPFLRPVERTARLCGMEYWPPYVIHGTHRMNEDDIRIQATLFADLLSALRDDEIPSRETETANYLNELLPIRKSLQT